MEPVAKLSLRQAAEWARTTKPTVLKHIQAGKVSGEKDEEGRWWFDVSELVRAYGEPRSGNASETDALDNRNPRGNSPETLAQQALVDELRARIAELKTDKDELRRQVEEERAERARLLKLMDEHTSMVRLLTDERRERHADPLLTPSPPKEPEPASQPQRGGFLTWLRGRR